MKRLLLTLALLVAATAGIAHLIVRPGTPIEDALASRAASPWYQTEQARLAKGLEHAAPGSAQAFKLQAKLDRLEAWQQGETRMGYPEEFARVLYERRIPADRTIPDYQPGYLQRELAKAKRFPAAADKSVVWQSRGPGNVAGRARTIIVDPDDPTGDTWFITSVGGGVWLTSDAGSTWSQLMDDQPLLATQCLAMAASNTSVLYAGTGESYFNVDTMNGNGILKSTDKGQTWTQLASTTGDPRFNNVARIIVSPTDPNLVLAATTVGRYKSYLYPTTHIFRSTDGGSSWTEVYDNVNGGGSAGPRVQQLLADPNNFNIQYATVYQTGILKSTDAGQTWNEINSGITDLSGRFEMAISPVSSSYLYVSAQGAAGSKLFVSLNGGSSWDDMSNAGGTSNWLGSQGWYDNTIVCDPTNPAIVYVGGPQLYQLDLNINTKSYTSTPLASYSFPHPDHHWLEIVKPLGGAWYLLGTNDGGVTRTASGVTGFTMPIDGMVTTQFYGVDKRPGASAYIGGMQDNGTWQSPVDPASGDAWDFRIGGDGYETSWHFDDPLKIMGGYQYNGLQRSLDGGATWSSATAGLGDTGGGYAPFITKIASSWKRPDTVFAVGAQGVWRSTNFGASWSLAPVTLGEWGSISSFHDVRVSNADPDIVWAGSRMDASGDVMVSTDGGVTFNPSADYTTATMGGISGLATHPTEPNTAYALFSFAERPKILKTTDLGNTWTDISGFGSGSVSSNGFPDVAVYDLLVWPNDTQHLLAGTEIGLVESVDGGATWALTTDNLPAVGIWMVKAVEDELIVATHGRGIWSAQVPALAAGQVYKPLFENMFQSPGGGIEMAFNLRAAYDSTQIRVNGALYETVPANAALQAHAVSVPVAAPGLVTALARGFKGGVAYDSVIRQVDAVIYAEPIFDYANQLDAGGDAADFNLDGMSWATPAGFSNGALHTSHDYFDGSNPTAVLALPVRVSGSSSLSFREVAIVEPGEPGSVYGASDFWDYCIVEGSADGLTWQALVPGYDARDQTSWLNAYNSSSNGTAAMYAQRVIHLNDTFAAGDVILLRWRLFADSSVTAWGWAVDDIVITSTGSTPVGDVPAVAGLGQNYPNPFNPSTTISFELPRDGRARLQVYDARGGLVRTLIDGQRPAGPQSVVWDGRDGAGRAMASGVYLYRLSAGDLVQQRKMTLVK